MKRLKDKMLYILSTGLFLIAIQSLNSTSAWHIYQDKEPNSLKNMKEIKKFGNNCMSIDNLNTEEI